MITKTITATIAGLLLAGAAHPQQMPVAASTGPPNVARGAKVGGSPTVASRAQIHALRVAKCSYLWEQIAPHSYKPELATFFVSEHER